MFYQCTVHHNTPVGLPGKKRRGRQKSRWKDSCKRPQELQQMLQELFDESRRMCLNMNIAKTKVLVVDNTPINVNNVLIENVDAYAYLGQRYSLKEKNQGKEIQRRIMAGWAAYAKHWDIFNSNLAIYLKRDVYNSCVVPAMTYGAETWTLTKQAQNKLSAAQTNMERSMLNITYKERPTYGSGRRQKS